MVIELQKKGNFLLERIQKNIKYIILITIRDL